MDFFVEINDLTGYEKIIMVLLLSVAAHVIAKLIQMLSLRFSRSAQSDRSKTVASLFVSILVFAIYFITFGVVLQELGVSLSTYIASASVIGIAVGFGTQSVAQDVINGMTIIMTDMFTVGDMVEISGQTGIVQQVSMRFVILSNPLGAKVYIPTRTVSNVINYPRGYIRCLVDISLADKTELRQFQTTWLEKNVESFVEQFPGILRAEPEIEQLKTAASGKHYVRVKFRIWPNRGSAIETTFKQDLLDGLKLTNPNVPSTAISVNYEVAA